MTVDLPDSLRGSFGCPVPGLEHKLVDPDSGLELAGMSDRSAGEKSAGEAGEICVRGYSLMQGLYKQQRDSVFDEAGWYHTGDGGSFNEQGHLFFEGRLGDVIKTGGANVSPREVEVLLEAVDGVKAAHVVGLPDPDRGQTVAAAVLLKQGVELDGEQLLAALRDELSAYKLPRQIFFLGENELPMTDSGKIKKSALAGQLQDLSKAGRGGA
jgi:acyl-CoA synthetase (AMP-forming)/AMP-acid ligase II